VPGIFLGAALLTLALNLMHPSVATAIGTACGTAGGYHYAGQLTSHLDAHTECSQINEEYLGWNGVDGQITTPGTTYTLIGIDHVSGFIANQMNFDATWQQTGWYTGTITDEPPGTCDVGSCVARIGNYGRFIEMWRNRVGYSVYDYGAASTGSSTTSRVVYNSSSGCWEVYLTYGGGVSAYDCTGEPTTGAMYATTEMASVSGSVVPLAIAYFGTSDPNTNQALRLHGAAGWGPWNTTLTAYYTERFDERDYTPEYTESSIKDFWYIEAYKN
jgi:hypothetical protein